MYPADSVYVFGSEPGNCRISGIHTAPSDIGVRMDDM